MKTRLLGAAVLIALAVIIVPLFFSGKPAGSGSRHISLDIPQAPDEKLQTRTMSVSSSASPPSSTAASGQQLARVDIPSRVPAEVEPGQAAASATTTARPSPGTKSGAASAQSRSPAASASKNTVAGTAKPTSHKSSTSKPPASKSPGRAAVARYRISLGAYTHEASARKLQATARKQGYSASLQKVRIHGKPATRVEVGPFDSRAAAESARLKLHQAMPHAAARLVSAPATQEHDAKAKALPSGKAGGWAVQLVAYSKQADADQLRDKLRKAGFDGYVDRIQSHGKTLWRVRVGPDTQRREAVAAQKHIARKFPRLKGVIVTVP